MRPGLITIVRGEEGDGTVVVQKRVSGAARGGLGDWPDWSDLIPPVVVVDSHEGAVEVWITREGFAEDELLLHAIVDSHGTSEIVERLLPPGPFGDACLALLAGVALSVSAPNPAVAGESWQQSPQSAFVGRFGYWPDQRMAGRAWHRAWQGGVLRALETREIDDWESGDRRARTAVLYDTAIIGRAGTLVTTDDETRWWPVGVEPLLDSPQTPVPQHIEELAALLRA